MESGGGKLRALIEKATHSTSREVDSSLLKAIKMIVRSSDDNVHIAYETLMECMKKNHSQVRYLALLVIDELFMRSKLFRSSAVESLDKLLSLSVGFRRNDPLPPPATIATTLRSKAIELLEKWNDCFGIHYRQIRLGFDYLKNTLHFQFPNLQETAARVMQQRREREIRTQEILANKIENLRINYSSISEEIQRALNEIEECIQVICTLKTNNEDAVASHDAIEDFGSLSLRKIRQEAIKEGEKIHEDSNNQALFDALRELYKLLLSRHVKTVQNWISVLIRVDVADIRLRDTALKQFIDFRNHIQSVKKQCENLVCILPDVEADEEILWEEGKIEESIEIVPESKNPNATSDAGLCRNDTSNKAADISEDSNGKLPEIDDGSGSYREKLLNEAPVVKWGSYLDNWGTNRVFLANHRGLELDNHWGRVDADATIPAEKIAELAVQATIYEEEPSEIQPCFAPLKKGGLCQRRDLRVCPFHGPIVRRDSEGKPLNENNLVGSSNLTTQDSDVDMASTTEEIARSIAEQAIKNIRKRDKEKEVHKQEAKRAKLTKVREHNAAVLRESAMTSTWQGLGEALGSDLEGTTESLSKKPKKDTLSSMLKKKVTSRDRLSQRLLNSQTTEATIRQITQGDEAKYREAYPNQW